MLENDDIITRIKRMIRLALSEDEVVAALSNVQDIADCLNNESCAPPFEVLSDIEYHAEKAKSLLINVLNYGHS
jgi:hypothetical protein